MEPRRFRLGVDVGIEGVVVAVFRVTNLGKPWG